MPTDSIKIEQDKGRLILTISPSSLNEFQLCPRRYFYTREYEPAQVLRADSLDLGSSGHTGLETFYSLTMKNEGSYDSRVELALKAARQYAVEKTSLDMEKVEHLISCLTQYFEYRRDEKLEVLAVEQPFSKLLHEDSKYVILFEGRLDLLCNWQDAKRIMDHKIVSQNREPLGLSNQNLGYAFATGIDQVVINTIGLQKSQPHDKFHRFMFRYEPSQLAEWHNSTVTHWINLLIHYMESEKELHNGERSSAWPMNLTSCDKFSGCSFAKFVCSSQPDTRASKLAMFYKPRSHREIV